MTHQIADWIFYGTGLTLWALLASFLWLYTLVIITSMVCYAIKNRDIQVGFKKVFQVRGRNGEFEYRCREIFKFYDFSFVIVWLPSSEKKGDQS